jgi:hypothetical protein
MEFDPVCNTQTTVEIEQVGTAAQKYVLAIVNGGSFAFVSGIQLVGSRSPAQERPRFIQGHVVVGRSERRG